MKACEARCEVDEICPGPGSGNTFVESQPVRQASHVAVIPRAVVGVNAFDPNAVAAEGNEGPDAGLKIKVRVVEIDRGGIRAFDEGAGIIDVPVTSGDQILRTGTEDSRGFRRHVQRRILRPGLAGGEGKKRRER